MTAERCRIVPPGASLIYKWSDRISIISIILILGIYADLPMRHTLPTFLSLILSRGCRDFIPQLDTLPLVGPSEVNNRCRARKEFRLRARPTGLFSRIQGARFVVTSSN
jgi:hypothetical protein